MIYEPADAKRNKKPPASLRAAPQRGPRMIDGDWLSLVRHSSLYHELMPVAQPRKLFRLGAAFLTRVRDRFPTSSDQIALEVTNEYADDKTNLLALVEAWTTAELDGGEGIWSYQDHWCDCCDPDSDDWPYLPGALEYARNPVFFAAHAAFMGLKLASGGFQHRLHTINDAMRAEAVAQQALYRDLIGDDASIAQPSPVRLGEQPALRQLLAAIDRQDAPDGFALIALADALEEAGCDDWRLLTHLRAKTEHYRGCWAIERIAGREMIELRAEKAVLTPRGRYERPWRLGW